MKRYFNFTLLTVIFLCTAASAQTVLFSDNFDSYTADSTLKSSNPQWWTTWSGATGGADDGVISNAHAASAPNSLHISNANDQVFFVYQKPRPYPYQNINRCFNVRNGHYSISFNYYVPSDGPGAYFNVQQSYNNLWAFAVYFRNNGTGYFITGGDTTEVTYPSSQWFPILVDVDLSHDIATLKINNVAVKTWPWHYEQNSKAYDVITLDVVNFYSNAPGDVAGDYYVDDFVVTEHVPFIDTIPVSADSLHISLAPNDIDTIELSIDNPDFHNSTFKNIIIYEIPNPDMTPTGIIELDNQNNSIHSVVKCDSLPADDMKVAYSFAYAFDINTLKPHIGKTIQKVRFPLGKGATEAASIELFSYVNSGTQQLCSQSFEPVEGINEISLETPVVIDGSNIAIRVTFHVRTDSCYTLVIGDSLVNSSTYNTPYCYWAYPQLSPDGNISYPYYNYHYDSAIAGRTIPISIVIDGTPISQWLDCPAELTIDGNGSAPFPIIAKSNNMAVGEHHKAKIYMSADRFTSKILPVFLEITHVGVNERNEIEVSVYPNPATDHLQIVSDEIQRVEVYNLMGQCVFSKNYGDTHVIIPTSGMAPGTYIVNVTTTAGKTTKKILVR